MSQKAINYLQKYKDAYPRESLVNALKDAGYVQRDIKESVKFVYKNNMKVAKEDNENIIRDVSLLDFRSVKVYKGIFSKLLDFVLGIIIVWILYWVGNSILRDIFYSLFSYRAAIKFSSIVVLVLLIFLIKHFHSRRRFISYALIISSIILTLNILSFYF